MKNFKSLLFSLCLALLFLGQVTISSSSEAKALDYIDYETFTQLDHEGQKKVVLMVMDYIRALESLTPDKELQKNQELQKTVNHLRTLWNQIILNSAFANSLPKGNQELCVYGGWISFMRGGLCSHPANITPKNTKTLSDKSQKILEETKKIYGDSKKEADKCNTPSMIVCNPNFFGESIDKKPFCVDGNKASRNTSLQCYGAFLEANTKSNGEVLDNLINKLLSTPEASASFSEMLKMMYGTCMCGDYTNINRAYAQKIYDHRTCFGINFQTTSILNKVTSGSVSNACLQNLKNNSYVNDVSNMYDFSIMAYETLEKEFISENYKDSKYFDETYGHDNAPSAAEKKLVFERRQNLTKREEAGQCPLFRFTIFISKGDRQQDGTYPVTATIKGINPKLKIKDISWKIDGTQVENKNDSNDVLMVPESDKEQIVIATLDKEKSNEEKIPAKEEDVVPQEESSCKITKIENEDEKIFSYEVEPSKEIEVAEINWTPSIEDEKTQEEKKLNNKITYKEKQKEVSAEVIYKDKTKENCALTEAEDSQDKDNKDEGYSIQIEKTKEGKDADDFKAVIKKDGKVVPLPEGAEIKWYGKKIIKTKEDDKKDKDKEKTDYEKRYDDEFKSTSPTPDGATHLGDGETISVKKDSDYEQDVDAKLVLKDKKEISSNKLKVNKKAKAKPKQNYNPNGPLPPQGPNLYQRNGLRNQRGLL